MSHQEEIEQFLFLDHSQPPRQLSPEDIERFLDLCKRLNYLGIAGVLPRNSSKNSVAGLIRMVDMGEVRIDGGDVAGPYVMGQNGATIYYPEGIMIYQRPA